MNIQIFGKSKCFDTKKAERWFKERRIKFQAVDVKKYGMSLGELTSVKNAVGLAVMVDTGHPDAALLSYLAEERPDLVDEYLRDHLLTWALHYLEALEAAADHPFYQGLAALTRSTLLGLQAARGLEVTLPHFYC